LDEDSAEVTARIVDPLRNRREPTRASGGSFRSLRTTHNTRGARTPPRTPPSGRKGPRKETSMAARSFGSWGPLFAALVSGDPSASMPAARPASDDASLIATRGSSRRDRGPSREVQPRVGPPPALWRGVPFLVSQGSQHPSRSLPILEIEDRGLHFRLESRPGESPTTSGDRRRASTLERSGSTSRDRRGLGRDTARPGSPLLPEAPEDAA